MSGPAPVSVLQRLCMPEQKAEVLALNPEATV